MTAVGQVCASRRVAWAAALFVVVLTFLAQAARLAEPDMAYMLYAAGRLLDGAKLYRDVVDINPPPIFAFNLPVVWLARTTHLPDILTYRLTTLLVLGALLLFVRRLLRRDLLAGRPMERRYVLLLLCFILFPLSREDFGQREHLVLALLLPYLVVVITRLGRREVAVADATAAGALAGLALALKPPFAVVWLLVEAWYRLHRRAERLRLTPELYGVVGVTAAYVVVVVTLLPDYPRLVLMLGAAYTTYLRTSQLSLLLLAPGAPLTAFALLVVLAARSIRNDGDGRAVLGVAMLGCFLAGVAQQKDLRYHFYPSFALATLVLGLVAAQPGPEGGFGVRTCIRIARYLILTIALVVLAGSVLDVLGGGRADRRRRADLGQLLGAVRARAGGEPMGMLSYHMGSAFPLVNYAGVSLASRFPCLWILPASYWDALSDERPITYHTPAKMDPPERMLNEAVADDLLRARPRLLLILRPFPDQRPYGFRRLNYVAYFARDARLAALFAGYQFLAAEGQYDLYERLDPGTTRTGPPPSAAVARLPAAPAQTEGHPPLVDPELTAGTAIFLAIVAGSLIRGCLARSRSLRSAES